VPLSEAKDLEEKPLTNEVLHSTPNKIRIGGGGGYAYAIFEILFVVITIILVLVAIGFMGGVELWFEI